MTVEQIDLSLEVSSQKESPGGIQILTVKRQDP